MHQLFTIIALIAMLGMVAPSLHAQFRASLRGVVSDPQGAMVPDATVILVDKSTNQTLTTKTNASGIYTFNALPPDHFTLTQCAECMCVGIFFEENARRDALCALQ